MDGWKKEERGGKRACSNYFFKDNNEQQQSVVLVLLLLRSAGVRPGCIIMEIPKRITHTTPNVHFFSSETSIFFFENGCLFFPFKFRLEPSAAVHHGLVKNVPRLVRIEFLYTCLFCFQLV